MKNAVLKTGSSKGGFLQTMLAPVNDRMRARFETWEAFGVFILALGVFLVARFLLAQ